MRQKITTITIVEKIPTPYLDMLQAYKEKEMMKEFWLEFDKRVINDLLITGEVII